MYASAHKIKQTINEYHITNKNTLQYFKFDF